uniref:Uncharacterized protein n=1 Tax=Solanum lycopersicum TaxID=4081 RepID=K4CJP4_SOLLC
MSKNHFVVVYLSVIILDNSVIF